MSYESIKSVIKAMKVLELLIEKDAYNEPLTLADTAKKAGISTATARNILRTFEECGYAKRFKHGMYEVGERANTIVRTGINIKLLKEVASPEMENLSQMIDDRIVLSSIINGNRVELFRRAGPDEDKQILENRASDSLYAMRSTRIMLAWFTQDQLELFITKYGLPSVDCWPECNNSLSGMQRELKSIVCNGGIIDKSYSNTVIVVPIFSPTREIIAALGCYSTEERTDIARAKGIFGILQECAERMKHSL